ncbi:MAG: hypothetical protein Q4G68_04410 [Planctomycetia bacterium]|nr:hypothetical protein [Planctomycetia bacterium]
MAVYVKMAFLLTERPESDAVGSSDIAKNEKANATGIQSTS